MKALQYLTLGLGLFCGTVGYAAEGTQSTDEIAISQSAPVAFATQVRENAKVLAQTGLSDDKRQGAIKFFIQEREKAPPELIKALDWEKNADNELRLGALKGIEAAKASNNNLSVMIAKNAVADPDEGVRKAAVAMIKSRKDDVAVGMMMGYALGAVDEYGKVTNEKVLANAAAGLRNINDKRVYESLYQYYCVLEIRPTVAELKNLETLNLQVLTTTGTGANPATVPIVLPIQFPTLAISKVRTTVSVPAGVALAAISGQNFGNNPAAWRNWINKQ